MGFKEEIRAIFKGNDNFDTEKLFKDIEEFKKTNYGPMSFIDSNDDFIQELLDELDWIIYIQSILYADLCDCLFKGERVDKYADTRDFSSYVILQIKFLLEDYISVRHLACYNYESQVVTLVRVIFERFNKLVLVLSDYEYACDLLYNDKKYNSKDFYNKVSRNSTVRKKILDGVKNEKLHKSFLFIGESSQSIEKNLYGLFSEFIHSDFQKNHDYHIEKDDKGMKINFALQAPSPHFRYRMNYLVEYALNGTIMLLLYFKKYTTVDIEVMADYLQGTIERRYANGNV